MIHFIGEFAGVLKWFYQKYVLFFQSKDKKSQFKRYVSRLIVKITKRNINKILPYGDTGR